VAVLPTRQRNNPLASHITTQPALNAFVILVAGPATNAVLLAELLLVARIALIGIVVARQRKEPTSSSNVLAGIALALLAMAIVVTKVVLTH
jgi:hypothetical protein